MQARRPRAFTLIEVLVVVAIIALLISILIPSLTKARDQARSAKCLANMRDMNTSVNTFAQTHRGRFQLVSTDGADGDVTKGRVQEDPDHSIYAYDNTPARELLNWPAVLMREGGVRSIKRNADWGILGQSNAAANLKDIRLFGLLSCPGDKILYQTPFWPQPYYGYLSYGINEDVTGAYTDDPPDCVWSNGQQNKARRLAGRLDRVKTPATVVLVCDAGSEKRVGARDNEAVNLLLSKNCPGPLLEYFESVWVRFDNTSDSKPFQRHLYGTKRGAVNLVYIDGHAGFARRFDRGNTGSTLDPKEYYAPKVRVSPYVPGQFPSR